MAYLDKAGLTHFWSRVKTAMSGKQNTLTGTQGQVVGFDAEGKAVAQAPSVTMVQVNEAIDAAITGTMEASY